MMSDQLTLLLLLCVLAIACDCRPLSNNINSTEDKISTTVTTEIKTTKQPIATEMLQANIPESYSSSLSPSANPTGNGNVRGRSPTDSWMRRNSAIPVLTLSCIVLMLVFVVSALSLIILVYRRRMRRMKTLIIKLPSPSASPTRAQIKLSEESDGDFNHNPQWPEQLTVTAPTDVEIIQSLKYDQPYAHQKSITDRVRQMMVTPPVSPQSVSSPLPDFDAEPYLTPKEITPSSTEPTALDDSLASGDSAEYQVPRNAKKRAGLITRDPSTKEASNEEDYVVMMGDQPITDDEKTERSFKRSTKESIKKGANTLKKIPENLASRIRFFQEKMKADHKDVAPQTDETPEYDVPKGIPKKSTWNKY